MSIVALTNLPFKFDILYWALHVEHPSQSVRYDSSLTQSKNCPDIISIQTSAKNTTNSVVPLNCIIKSKELFLKSSHALIRHSSVLKLTSEQTILPLKMQHG